MFARHEAKIVSSDIRSARQEDLGIETGPAFLWARPQLFGRGPSCVRKKPAACGKITNADTVAIVLRQMDRVEKFRGTEGDGRSGGQGGRRGSRTSTAHGEHVSGEMRAHESPAFGIWNYVPGAKALASAAAAAKEPRIAVNRKLRFGGPRITEKTTLPSADEKEGHLKSSLP